MFLMAGCGGGASPVRQTDLGGLFPPVTVVITHLTDWTVSLVSSQQLDEVTLYFDNGDSEHFDLTGLVGLVHSANPGEMTYLKTSTKGGDYWYFDRSGQWLPNGYKPKFQSSLGRKRASSVWVGGTELGITCSDQYSQVKVYFNDDTYQIFETAESSGTYNLLIASENVAAIRITLSADSSLYFYGADGGPLPQGTKWYEDAD
jgi:hypothetical protein